MSFDSLGSVDDDLDWNFLEILGGLDSEMDELNLENLGLDREGLVVWHVMWSSLVSPPKIRMLAPTRIVGFRVWGVERLPLVVKGIGLFNLNGSLNLRKIWAVNGRVCRVIAYNAWLLYSRSIWC